MSTAIDSREKDTCKIVEDEIAALDFQLSVAEMKQVNEIIRLFWKTKAKQSDDEECLNELRRHRPEVDRFCTRYPFLWNLVKKRNMVKKDIKKWNNMMLVYEIQSQGKFTQEQMEQKALRILMGKRP